MPVPGSRTVPAGRAKNLIIADYDETYHESWFTDAQSMVNNSPATHQLAQQGIMASETWTQYGWSPIDHYQIAVGSYPAWRTPDAPGKVWGQPDGLDTNIWYGGTEQFGQQSIFDVAKSYGMNTAVIGGNDYPTGHITNSNVDQITLGQNINGVPTQWVTEVENFITAHASNPNGFLIYMPITEAEGRSVESTSPDDSSSQGLYQQASSWDDQAFGQLQTWLQQNNYTSNTAISITSDEAQNDHTSFDNFYGLGSTGQGTSRHIPFVLSGPGIVKGQQLFRNTTNDQAWLQMNFDLSSYAGQTIGIQFLDHENSGGGPYYNYMHVDDVSLNVS